MAPAAANGNRAALITRVNLSRGSRRSPRSISDMAPGAAREVPIVRAMSSRVDECAVSTASHHHVVVGVTPFGPSVNAARSASAGARHRPRWR